MKYWLMKSEPDAYSIDDFAKEKTTLWDGIRNYQARNFMTQEMAVGDQILFYHSNSKPSGVVGVAKVSKPAVPDPTQFDKKSDYFFPKATKEKPVWFCVELEFQKKLQRIISLEELKKAKALKDMMVIKRGQRLSIQPVTAKEFDAVVAMAES